MARRLIIGLLLGIGMLPIAGYIGAAVMPSVALLWVGVLLLHIAWWQVEGALAVLIAPAFVGVHYAWPVLCVVLPVAAAFHRSIPAWSALSFLAIGAVSGALVCYFKTPALVPAGAFTGALLGCLFGFAMWRADRNRIFDQTPESQRRLTTWRLEASFSLGVLFLGVLCLALLPSSPS